MTQWVLRFADVSAEVDDAVAKVGAFLWVDYVTKRKLDLFRLFGVDKT